MQNSIYNSARVLLILLTVCCACANVALAESPQVMPVDGAPFAATLTSLDGDTATFSTEAGPRKLPLDAIVRWGRPVEPRGDNQVLLADGSLLVGEVYRIADDRLVLITDLFEEVSVPLSVVRGVLFHPPGDPQLRDRLAARASDAEATQDRVILANGDELSGSLLGAKLAADRLMIQLKTDIGQIEIEHDRIAALLLDPALLKTPKARGPQTLVGFKDGSLILADRFSLGENEAQLGFAGGIQLKSDRPHQIVFLQPLDRSLVYLSDLEPRSYKHVPYLSVAWPIETDASAAGGRLRDATGLYAKGLGMHSAARVMYVLPKGVRRLQAELAIDAAAGERGSVVFRVFTNTGQEWRPAFTSEVVRGGDPPTPISVDLEGVKAITLMVDYADRGDTQDHANWLDARLVK